MVNLVASYKDSAYLYMLLECVMGGELFTYLQVCTSTPHGMYQLMVIRLAMLLERNDDMLPILAASVL